MPSDDMAPELLPLGKVQELLTVHHLDGFDMVMGNAPSSEDGVILSYIRDNHHMLITTDGDASAMQYELTPGGTLTATDMITGSLHLLVEDSDKMQRIHAEASIIKGYDAITRPMFEGIAAVVEQLRAAETYYAESAQEITPPRVPDASGKGALQK